MKILLLTATLPLWSGIWQNAPLTTESTNPPAMKTYLSATEMNKYTKRLGKVSDPRIQSRMVRDIAQMNNPKVIPELYSLLSGSNPSTLQTEILASLYKLREIDTNPKSEELLPFLKSGNNFQRAYAAVCLVKTDKVNEVAKLLYSETSEFTINTVVEELLSVAHKHKFDRLETQLKNGTTGKTPYMVKLIAASKNDPDANSELQSIANGKDNYLKSMLAEGLLVRTKGGAKLYAKLSQSNDMRVRYIIAQSGNNPDYTKSLIKQANGPQPHIAAKALISLRSHDYSSVKSTLLNKLGDQHFEVREAAADSIIAIGKTDPQLQKRLISLLPDSKKHDAALRVVNELALNELNKQIAIAATKASSAIAKTRATAAVHKYKIGSGIPALIKFGQDKLPEVRKTAAIALGHFSGPSVTQAISKLLNDQDSGVLIAAIKAAGVNGDKQFSKQLGVLLKKLTAPSDVRSAACWAIARCGTSNPRDLNQLKSLCIKKVISMEGEKMFDDLNVRISAYYSMIDLAKNNTAAKKSLAELEKSLRFAADKEFKKQLKIARAYKDGKKATPLKAEPPKPQLTVKML